MYLFFKMHTDEFQFNTTLMLLLQEILGKQISFFINIMFSLKNSHDKPEAITMTCGDSQRVHVAPTSYNHIL